MEDYDYTMRLQPENGGCRGERTLKKSARVHCETLNSKPSDPQPHDPKPHEPEGRSAKSLELRKINLNPKHTLYEP